MLPPELQALKDAAASVQAEQRSVALEHHESHWRMLQAVAEASLGQLWKYVANMGERPRGFPSQGPPWGEFVFTAKIVLPSHRAIHALFSGHDQDTMRDGGWHRTYWPGAPTSDVANGLANWMVEPAGRGLLMTYYQTLGAALLAAEIKG